MDSYRRGNNGGQHPRGNQQWNKNQRTRFCNMQSQRGVSRGFVRPSLQASNSVMPPQMLVPSDFFGNSFMYPDMVPAAMFYPMYFPVQLDPDLQKKIVKQIEYYFSDENLVKDTYLRKKMDEQGWVHVNLIAGFKRVLCLTDNARVILDAMRTSEAVEVRGEKMRKRNEWKRWPLPRPLNVESLFNKSNSVSNCNKVGRVCMV